MQRQRARQRSSAAAQARQIFVLVDFAFLVWAKAEEGNPIKEVVVKSRWRIRQKLSAGLFLVVGMTALLSAGSFYGLYSYRRSNKVFDYQNQQQQRLGALVLACSDLLEPDWDAHNGQTNVEETSQRKLKKLEVVEMTLKEYQHGLENPVRSPFHWPSEHAKEQAARVDTHVREMLESVNRLKQSAISKNSATANTPIRRDIWWLRGHERDTIAKLKGTLQTLRGLNDGEFRSHVTADQGNYRASLAMVYSSSVLVVVMLIALAWFGYRSVFHPIRALHRGVLRLAGGDFNAPVQLDSGDEMQELAEAFNDMARRLQDIYKDLNRQVEERSRQLIRSERLASVGFLAAGVAHEINNPLASISLCGEALESRLLPYLPHGDDADVIRNYLKMIQQESFRCKVITEKLLNFSRSGAPERINADVVTLIREVIELVQHLGRARAKELIFEPRELVQVRGNPQELKQVLLNLVINALESVDDGGRVELRVRNEGKVVAIEVEDNGCGMTPEVLENLFEPFFTRNRSGKGTGLGLSISHLIISQHGGTLEAGSPGPNRGSKFVARLPAPQVVGQAVFVPRDQVLVGAA